MNAGADELLYFPQYHDDTLARAKDSTFRQLGSGAAPFMPFANVRGVSVAMQLHRLRLWPAYIHLV